MRRNLYPPISHRPIRTDSDLSEVSSGRPFSASIKNMQVPPEFHLTSSGTQKIVQMKKAGSGDTKAEAPDDKPDIYSEKYPNLDSLPVFVDREKGEKFTYSLVAGNFSYAQSVLRSWLEEMAGLGADKSLLEELSLGVEDLDAYLFDFKNKKGALDEDDLIYAEELSKLIIELGSTLSPKIEAERSKKKKPAPKKVKPQSSGKQILFGKASMETMKSIKKVEEIGSLLEKTLVIGTTINTATSLADPAEGLYMILTLDDPFTPVAQALSDIDQIKRYRIIEEISYLLALHSKELNVEERQYWEKLLASFRKK